MAKLNLESLGCEATALTSEPSPWMALANKNLFNWLDRLLLIFYAAPLKRSGFTLEPNLWKKYFSLFLYLLPNTNKLSHSHTYKHTQQTLTQTHGHSHTCTLSLSLFLSQLSFQALDIQLHRAIQQGALISLKGFSRQRQRHQLSRMQKNIRSSFLENCFLFLFFFVGGDFWAKNFYSRSSIIWGKLGSAEILLNNPALLFIERNSKGTLQLPRRAGKSLVTCVF